MPKYAVLFVCMGNICRSPTAHGVFKRKLIDEGIAQQVKVDSAGTHNYHPGSPPDERSQVHAAKRGYDRLFATLLRRISSARPRAAADNVRMKTLIDHARRVCTALVGVAAVMVTMANPLGPTAASPVQTKVHAFDGHRVTLDVYPAVGPLRGAAILSHGFTRSRRTLAGHAQALADAGVLVLTPDLPCTFDFRCNARALTAMVGSLRAGGTFGAPVKGVMLVGFSAGGLSSLLAADALGVVGFVGLDPFDRTMPGEAERLGLAAAGRLRTEALLLRAPPSSCNAEAVAASWATALPALWRDELITGASHCDFESPTDWMCRLACGDTDPARQERVRQELLDAAARWMR